MLRLSYPEWRARPGEWRSGVMAQQGGYTSGRLPAQGLWELLPVRDTQNWRQPTMYTCFHWAGIHMSWWTVMGGLLNAPEACWFGLATRAPVRGEAFMEPTVGKVGLQQILTSGPSQWEYWLPAAHSAFLERETISPGLSPDAILTFYMFFLNQKYFGPVKAC